MRLYTAALVLSFLLSPLSVLADTKPLIRFSCTAGYNSAMFKALQSLYSDAFNSLGYHFSMHQNTAAASLSLADQGSVDGECIRVKGIEQQQNNLIRVDVILAQAHFSLWSYREDLHLKAMTEIDQQQLQLGYIKGTRAVEEYLDNIGQSAAIFSSHKLALRALKIGQIDLLLVVAPALEIGLDGQQEFGYPQNVFKVFRTQGYPYLHKNNASLKAPLEAALKRLLSNPQHPIHNLSD